MPSLKKFRRGANSMSTNTELKSTVQAELDRRGQEAIDIAKVILNNPEPGFKEYKTSKLVTQTFDQWGIPYEDGIGITGVKGILDSGKPGPTVAVMGELDSLKVLGHPHADPDTTAAHACGRFLFGIWKGWKRKRHRLETAFHAFRSTEANRGIGFVICR